MLRASVICSMLSSTSRALRSGQVRDDTVERGARPARQPERRGDLGADELGVGDRVERHEEGAAGEPRRDLGRDLDRQAGLARAAGPGQRQQATGRHEMGDLLHLRTSHERRDLGGQARPDRLERPKRRELLPQALARELEDPDRLRQVLQAVLAEVGRARPPLAASHGRALRSPPESRTWSPCPAAVTRAVSWSARPM